MSIVSKRRNIFTTATSSGGVQSVNSGTDITVDNTDPANPIINFTGTYQDPITVVANYSALPTASTVTGDFYWCSSSQGTAWLPGSLGGTYYNSGLYYSNGVTWEYMDTPYQATQADVNTGTVTDQFVSPATFAGASKWADYLPLAGGTMDSGADIAFINGSKISEGTIDSGLGGSKGIAQICAVGYELKWEAGRLYVMDGNGVYIRWSLYNFNITPTINDDVTKGYLIGSRWSLDNGDVYECTDATTGAAVWILTPAGTSNLQQVTDIGNITTNDIIIQGVNDYIGQVSSQIVTVYNTVTGAYTEMFVDTKGKLTLSDGTSAGIFTINNLVSTNVQLEFPNKTTGTYTIATTDTTVSSVGATSPITSSGGTTPTISTSMNTNKLIGRSTAGTGVMEEITVGSGLSLSGGTISATAQNVGFEQNFLLMGA